MPLPSIVKKIPEYVADTPATRPIAALAASLVASAMLKRRVRIFFDSVWWRKDGQTTVSLGRHLRIRPSQIRQWKANATDTVDEAANWWFLH